MYDSPKLQTEAMVKKYFAFEELTYLDTADKELKKMIDLHVN